jgi:hypothetical protein
VFLFNIIASSNPFFSSSPRCLKTAANFSEWSCQNSLLLNRVSEFPTNQIFLDREIGKQQNLHRWYSWTNLNWVFSPCWLFPECFTEKRKKILFGRQFYTRIYNELIYKRILFVISSIYDYYLRKKWKKSFNKFWNFIKTITM